MRAKCGSRTRNAGQTLVEFALALPFFLLCLVSVIYFGKLFFVKQVVCYAAQEGARVASRMPDLSNPQTLDRVRGFDDGGNVVGPDDESNPSPIYRALSAGQLLSGPNGKSGPLPAGARVVVEGASPGSDRVTVTVEYPFGLFFNPQTGSSSGEVTQVNIAMTASPGDTPVPFADFVVKEAASAAQEVYQQ